MAKQRCVYETCKYHSSTKIWVFCNNFCSVCSCFHLCSLVYSLFFQLYGFVSFYAQLRLILFIYWSLHLLFDKLLIVSINKGIVTMAVTVTVTVTVTNKTCIWNIEIWVHTLHLSLHIIPQIQVSKAEKIGRKAHTCLHWLRQRFDHPGLTIHTRTGRSVDKVLAIYSI